MIHSYEMKLKLKLKVHCVEAYIRKSDVTYPFKKRKECLLCLWTQIKDIITIVGKNSLAAMDSIYSFNQYVHSYIQQWNMTACDDAADLFSSSLIFSFCFEQYFL